MEWRDLWRHLFPKESIEPDVQEEIAFHIQGRIDELIAQGWSESEARARVLERFGDVELVEEACRTYDTQRVDDERWGRIMEAWMRDARLAARTMRRQWGFTTVVVVTLALGVGASTAVFSVVDGILLRPLPFPDAEALAVVWQNDRATGTERENASPSDYYDYVERNRSFEELAIFNVTTSVLTRDGVDPLQLNTAVVSASLTSVLGLNMQLGRSFTAAEDVPDGPAVIVLTDRVWRDAFGADPLAIGQAIVVDDIPHEVIGVLPAGIDYPAGETDVWLPIRQSPTVATRQNHWVRVIGRLAPEATIASAHADMTRIMADLEVEYPEANQNRGAFVERLQDVGRGDLRQTLWVLFGAVLAVLAIACVNVANLLLARGAARSRELAVLTAVGAGKHQIRRKFFVEGALVAGLAGLLGVVLATLGVRALTALAPANLLVLGTPRVAGRVLGFTLAVTALISLGFGLLPALQARGLDLQRQLKEARTTAGGAAGLRVRQFLVAGQLSLAVVLLLGATLLMGTMRNLQSVDPGFRAENSLRIDFALPASRYPTDFSTYPDWPEIQGFMGDLIAEAEAVPGVSRTAVVVNHPLQAGFTNSFRIEGQAYDPTQGEMTTRLITPGYFETAGLTLEQGRLLDEGDRVGSPDAILINREAADRYFPDGDALGGRIGIWGPGFREIVGIVANERVHGLTAAPPPAMYISMFQSPPLGGRMTLMARTDVPPLSVADGLREAMRNVDPGVPVFNVTTMEATLADAMARERFASTVLSVFAAVALFLAVLGVYGALAYLVAQRGHEVGVRMALGATRNDVIRLVVRQGVAMTVLGVGVGLAGAAALSGLIQDLLFGVSATSPGSYVLVGFLLSAVAMAASVLPAHRAASIDPADSLRMD